MSRAMHLDSIPSATGRTNGHREDLTVNTRYSARASRTARGHFASWQLLFTSAPLICPSALIRQHRVRNCSRYQGSRDSERRISMVGGLKPPSEEEENAAVIASNSGVIFVLEDADLQVGKVGKVRAQLASARAAGGSQSQCVVLTLFASVAGVPAAQQRRPCQLYQTQGRGSRLLPS